MTDPRSVGSTRSSLIWQIKARDSAAWRRFSELYGPLVYHWLRRRGLGDQDTADLFQEVFLAVSSAVDGYEHERPDSTFRGWLWTITRSKIVDLHRRHRDHVDAVGGSQHQMWLAQVPQHLPDDDEDPIQRSLTTSLVHRAMESVRGEFEEGTWQAFWRVTVQGDSTAEVAADWGITANAVRQAKSRVLRRLREELGDVVD